jgi:phosphoglycolate phosphatase
MHPPLQHIIWDWNGTLLDDTSLCIEVMNGLLAERAMPPLTKARYLEIFDFPVVDYYRRLGFDFERDPFDIVGAEFIRRYEVRRNEAALHAGARSILESIRASGRTQSVLSAYRHDTLEELLAHHAVRHFFSGVLGSDNVYAHGKLEQGRRWIRELGLDPHSVVLIGDTRHDFEVATAMGCRCLLVADGYHPRAKLDLLGAEVVVNELSEAQAWLEEQRP